MTSARTLVALLLVLSSSACGGNKFSPMQNAGGDAAGQSAQSGGGPNPSGGASPVAAGGGTGGRVVASGAGGAVDESPPTMGPRTIHLAYTGAGARKGLNADLGTHNLGRQFEVMEEGVTLLDLGAWDLGADGLAGPHVVTLFSLNKLGEGAKATPVAGGSVTVPAGTDVPLEGGFRFQSLAAPVSLPPGPYAVVAYGMNADSYGDGGSVPLASAGVRDAAFDVSDSAPIQSPTYPKGGDSNNHTAASFHFQSRHEKTLRIMALGDSLTEGKGGAAGYRSYLAELLNQRHVLFQLVGSLVTNPGTLEPDQTHHEGHAGAFIQAAPGHAGIADSIDTYLGPTGADADCILLLVGTEALDADADADAEIDSVVLQMDGLITHIANQQAGAAPAARLVVAQLPPVQDDVIDARVVGYNAKLATVVAAHTAAGENVRLVDMHSILGADDFFDTLHPNDAGYKKMAAAWLGAIQAD